MASRQSENQPIAGDLAIVGHLAPGADQFQAHAAAGHRIGAIKPGPRSGIERFAVVLECDCNTSAFVRQRKLEKQGAIPDGMPRRIAGDFFDDDCEALAFIHGQARPLGELGNAVEQPPQGGARIGAGLKIC